MTSLKKMLVYLDQEEKYSYLFPVAVWLFMDKFTAFQRCNVSNGIF